MLRHGTGVDVMNLSSQYSILLIFIVGFCYSLANVGISTSMSPYGGVIDSESDRFVLDYYCSQFTA
jgi:hypothetical protein